MNRVAFKRPKARPRSHGEGSGRSRPGIQVIARAAGILRALEGRDDGLSLGQIATLVHLPRSTVQRIVAALDNENFVIAASPTARVRLGPALLHIARSARFEIAEFVRPYMEELSRETGETVDLALLDGPKAVFVDQVQGTHRLRAVSAVGVSFPLHCTANGKALLAALAPEALARLKPQIRFGFGPSRGLWKRLEAELAEVRQTGIAYDREEHSPGISAVGTAMIGPQGELVAVSIPAPSVRFAAHEAELVAALRRCCSTLQNVCSGRENSVARPLA